VLLLLRQYGVTESHLSELNERLLIRCVYWDDISCIELKL
jgi:hypothetical protein